MKLYFLSLLNILTYVISGNVNCEKCLQRQLNGENIDCSIQCYGNYPSHQIIKEDCPNVLCNNYCRYGHHIDENNCHTCRCVEETPINKDNECPVQQPSCDQYNFICPKITEITTCNEGGIDGFTTFQLSVIVKPNVDVKNIYAIYGDMDTVMHVPRAYQSYINYGSNIGGVNPFFIDQFPDTRYDSWLTIGLNNGNFNNKLSSIGIDFNDWTETNDLETSNGAVFVMDPEEVIVPGNEYLIAQLTVRENSNPTAVLNIQGKRNGGRYVEAWSESNVRFDLISPQNANNGLIPRNCIIWYNGCNTCMVNNGHIGPCTDMFCVTEDPVRCLRYSNDGH